MEETLQTIQLRKNARRDFFRMGIALLALGAVYVAGQYLFLYLWQWLCGISPAIAGASWGKWAVTFVPLYLIAMPVCWLLMRRVPAEDLPQSKLGGKRFAVLMIMCFPIMYGGNIVGTLLSLLLSGGSAQNNLVGYLDSSLLSVLVAVVIAPCLEEVFFRKLLIDRCGKYGEKTAIILSGLTFGLFHMNLFQFFYAFGLGLIFAYVYTRTRRLRYSIIMHMIINFLGTVVAPWILSLLNSDAQMAMQTGDLTALMDILPALIVYMLYAFALIGLSIAGLVLLIVKRKKFVLQPASQELPKQRRVRTVYGNVGMILFILFCLGMTAYTLLA